MSRRVRLHSWNDRRCVHKSLALANFWHAARATTTRASHRPGPQARCPLKRSVSSRSVQRLPDIIIIIIIQIRVHRDETRNRAHAKRGPPTPRAALGSSDATRLGVRLESVREVEHQQRVSICIFRTWKSVYLEKTNTVLNRIIREQQLIGSQSNRYKNEQMIGKHCMNSTLSLDKQQQERVIVGFTNRQRKS